MSTFISPTFKIRPFERNYNFFFTISPLFFFHFWSFLVGLFPFGRLKTSVWFVDMLNSDFFIKFPLCTFCVFSSSPHFSVLVHGDLEYERLKTFGTLTFLAVVDGCRSRVGPAGRPTLGPNPPKSCSGALRQ